MKLTEQQLTKAIYSMWDFQQALSALTFLLEECDFESKYDKIKLRRFRCYESTVIIAMSKPIETTKGDVTIGFRALGIKHSQDEKALLARISKLRNKVIAHSISEEMHFRIDTFDVDGINMPTVQFNESLLLSEEELNETELLLKKMIRGISHFIFKTAQSTPELLRKYQEPKLV
jgi:hypothetical protein